ncbi:MAG: preprotein translocase subunit SecG [bacterium]|nr:preprotein translocase subunit SecG [bacterium]
MEGFVLFIHIVVCTLLIVIVLLQSGKSADLAGAFGGAGSQSTFGPRGTASFLSKLTTTLAILFMITSLSLWIIAANKAESSSVIKEEPKQETKAEEAGDKAKTDEAAGTETKDAVETETGTETKPEAGTETEPKATTEADKKEEPKKPEEGKKEEKKESDPEATKSDDSK